MAEINNTVPTIVRGSSLYEAMCNVAKIANDAIADADKANNGVAEAKAAAAQAQATADQAHEEAQTAAANAEQAGEKAQEAQLIASTAANQASKAKDAADAAQATANGAVTKNTQQDARISDLESGKTVIPTYFRTTNQGNAIPGMNGAGTAAVYYWATGTTSGDLPLRRHNQSGTANGGLLVPRVPINADEAASKSYIDGQISAVKGLIQDANVQLATNTQSVAAGRDTTKMKLVITQLFGFPSTTQSMNTLTFSGALYVSGSGTTVIPFQKNILPNFPEKVVLTFYGTFEGGYDSRVLGAVFTDEGLSITWGGILSGHLDTEWNVTGTLTYVI